METGGAREGRWRTFPCPPLLLVCRNSQRCKAFSVGRRAWTECAETISCRCRLSVPFVGSLAIANRPLTGMCFVFCRCGPSTSARLHVGELSSPAHARSPVLSRAVRPRPLAQQAVRRFPAVLPWTDATFPGVPFLRRKPPVGVSLRRRPLFGLQRWRRVLPQCSQPRRAARKHVRRCLATRSRLGWDGSFHHRGGLGPLVAPSPARSHRGRAGFPTEHATPPSPLCIPETPPPPFGGFGECSECRCRWSVGPALSLLVPLYARV